MPESAKVKDISNLDAHRSPDVPTEGKPNGLLTREIPLSVGQADLAKGLLQAVNQARDVHADAQSRWETFLIGVGMTHGDEIVGGDLDSDDPNKRRLTITTGNGITKG
ncbi:hypothetical protein [Thalassospira alkalitolerans]|jgi:hypothetical protein|uniref:hypothetical protein n=1 Tax=Thalassospira alkalitolerans TaxID=1293890 RepID=UPI0030EC6562|tara:strand:+ start:340 stop:663 length:324 start_codon:yes stop_codon:yes gene_type:complete